MNKRHSQYDVSNSVDVSNTQAVCNAVCDIFHSCYPTADDSKVRRVFDDFDSLFEGYYTGYNACDTYYHDKQHTLDVTLALVRLIDGHERQSKRHNTFGANLTTVAIITALFHDSGYIRKRNDHKYHNGAQYTSVHISRSALFIQHYLRLSGMPQFAEIAANMVHYTGYEVAPENIQLPDEKLHLIGYMLGTADLIAQMSDHYYLEKCHDRLFAEFELGGITQRQEEDGQVILLFTSPDDLLAKTPDFYNYEVKSRINVLFKKVYKYAEAHFNGDNLYIEYLDNNIQHLEMLIESGTLESLSRLPPHHSYITKNLM